ncbi:MAG: hypothetical protein IJV68_00690 [Clostridia bacterium]|nr:hypothetical protein [Clostridia bacterium]
MSSKRKKITALCILAITLLAVGLVVFNLGISAAVSDTSVKLAGFWYNEIIEYSDIDEINIYTGFEFGKKQSGIGVPGTYRGIYVNDLLGEYECSANKDVSSAIVIKMTNGKYFVFNCNTREQTSQVYNFIKSRVN